MKIIKSLASIACPLVMMIGLLTGCNTAHGFGEDIHMSSDRMVSEADIDDEGN